ncbi:MAG TPA: hypothetical protein DIS73_00550 [Planctomycetia bacterium]|nr:hypothetical protein [Planctomycetia bacterium]
MCREHRISQTLYYRWRDSLLEGGRERLNGKKAEGKLGALRHAVERLQKLVRQAGHPDTACIYLLR